MGVATKGQHRDSVVVEIFWILIVSMSLSWVCYYCAVHLQDVTIGRNEVKCAWNLSEFLLRICL